MDNQKRNRSNYRKYQQMVHLAKPDLGSSDGSVAYWLLWLLLHFKSSLLGFFVYYSLLVTIYQLHTWSWYLILLQPSMLVVW